MKRFQTLLSNLNLRRYSVGAEALPLGGAVQVEPG